MSYTDRNLTTATFRAWAAGFVDRGGRIHVQRAKGRVLLSVTARDQAALVALQDGFQAAGDIDAHPRIVGLFVWRVTAIADVRRILTELEPYLTTLAADARAALADATDIVATAGARAQRDREIMARHLSGQRHGDIARALGITAQAVARAIERWRRDNETAIDSHTARRS